MDWKIVNPMPPELWLLPDWVPFAPWRFYAETRLVNLPMSYLYHKKWTYKGNTEFIRDLREELLVEPYEEINWAENIDTVAPFDKTPKSWIAKSANWVFLNILEPYVCPRFLKERAESWVSQQIDMQDLNTDYAGIAATGAPMNTMICYFLDGPDSIGFKRHVERLQEFLWMTADGMVINNTNGSQCWDTAFLVQAVCRCGFQADERWRPMLRKAYNYLERQQTRKTAWIKISATDNHERGAGRSATMTRGIQ